MFLQLAHTKPDAFIVSKAFVLDCYQLTKHFPAEEKFGMISQIRRAALSVHLNIAEGASRKSAIERKRFYEVARGSIVEVDAAFGIATELKYCSAEQLQQLGSTLLKTFKILCGLIG